MHIHLPPVGPAEIYSQGFWHAVLAAILYFIGASILVTNLTGYLRGHFPQQFDLDDDQRTLILQTMGFFFWLAGGAGIFSAIEGFAFANALYYADVVCAHFPPPTAPCLAKVAVLKPSSPSLQSASAISTQRRMQVAVFSLSSSYLASSN